jgi:hypothetical protein
MIVKNLRGKVQNSITLGLILIGSILVVLITSNNFDFFIEISDGFKYNQLFESLEDVDLISGYLIYIGYAGEPFTYLLFYIFAQFVSFLAFNNILNVLLLFSVFNLFYKHRVNLFISIPLILSNYYILLIQYGVIRLKIAIIFLMFSEISKNRTLTQLYRSLAVLAHFQIFIIIIFNYLYQFVKDKNVKFDTKIILYFCVFFFTFYSYLSSKINYYFSVNGIIFPYKVTLFLLFSMIILNKLKFTAISVLLLFPLALILGEGRIVIMYYFLVIIYFVKDKNKKILDMLFVIFISLYFSIKGLDFANSLIDNYDYFTSETINF